MNDKSVKRPPAGGEWVLCKLGCHLRRDTHWRCPSPGSDPNGFPVYFASSFPDQQTVPKEKRAAWLSSPAELRPDLEMSHAC